MWVLVTIALFALLLAAYGWWWRVVADGIRQNALAFQTEQTSLGRELTWSAFTVKGFPYRVETTISAPRFTAPDRGTEWRGERVVVNVQPLALNRAVFSLDGLQHFFYGKEGRWFQTEGRADKAQVTIATDRGVQNIGVDVEGLTGKATIDSDDFNVIVEDAKVNLDLSEANERELMARVELVLELENAAVQGRIDLPLGPTVSLFAIDAGLKFPTNIADASAATLLAAWRTTETPVDLRRFELNWGGIKVLVSGEFKLDAQSLPEGHFQVKLGNHPRILELLEAYGWITKETHSVAKPVLDLLAFASGDPERQISFPLRITKGDVYLGLVPVAKLQPPAPPAQ